MRTTIDLPDPLFKEAKSAAALRGQSLKEIVVTALRRELRNGRARPADRLRPNQSKFPVLACKGDFVINPTPEQLDDWL
jgi:hypothetical protein